MADCWNCGHTGHKSKHCTEPPKLTRCPSCNKVNGHDARCKNTTFRSELLKVDFQNVTERFFVDDVDRQHEIENVPLWLSMIDAHV